MANSLRTPICLALGALALGTSLLPIVSAQIDPDPAIFDAGQNGASSGNGKINSSAPPLGGQISVVNESQLPPIDIQTNIPGLGGNGINLPGVMGSVARQGISSSSSGIPIMGGSSGGMGGGQSSPFPMPKSSQSSQSMGQQSQGMPPMGQQSQNQGMQSSSGQMPQSQSQSQSQQAGQSGQMSQAQSQSSQSGSQAQISAQMPPAPQEQSIGDSSAQIDPNGELSSEGEDGDATVADSDSGNSEQSKNRKGRNGQPQNGQQQQDESQGDGQAMPEDIGGSQNNKRGTGTIDDVAVPTNL